MKTGFSLFSFGQKYCHCNAIEADVTRDYKVTAFWLQVSSFDIASDAFSTFKDLITRHRSLCARYFEANYENFFDSYRKLLASDNYVTRRQSLKVSLLEILFFVEMHATL